MNAKYDRVSLVKRDKPIKLPLIELLFSFKGRICRSQFLWAYLLATFVPLTITPLVFYNLVLYLFFYIIFLWPLFAIQAKRYHDLGKTGWWGLLQFLPGVGWLLVLCECGVTIGDFKNNEYGKSPYLKEN